MPGNRAGKSGCKMSTVRERQVLIELEAPDRWVYVLYDDTGQAVYVSREEWDVLCRPGPEDQG